ncbi:hypothetical protein AB4Y95_00390 [Arthrobacter sp. M-10]|uniref:hypothetical protein n=1 Tax=Arthrobacter sp. M-10 TaxID=3233037 RepID=UPI003F907A9A
MTPFEERVTDILFKAAGGVSDGAKLELESIKRAVRIHIIEPGIYIDPDKTAGENVWSLRDAQYQALGDKV